MSIPAFRRARIDFAYQLNCYRQRNFVTPRAATIDYKLAQPAGKETNYFRHWSMNLSFLYFY
jgi:hypothetical protein